MNVQITGPQPLHGTLTLPADKAICHRAALLGSLLTEPVEIRPWSPAVDCQRTTEALQQLGVSIAPAADGVCVQGTGLYGWRTPAGPLECGESGTTMRLLAGLLAGQPFTAHLHARGSLQQRPMRRIAEPLMQMGATLRGAQHNAELYPPLTITGRRPLRGTHYRLPVASAQVKSAVLLAGLFADGPTTVTEPIQTRDHTERLLRHLGAAVHTEGHLVRVEPPMQLRARRTLDVPGDVSSAAFFIAATTICPGSTLTIQRLGLNPTRIKFLDVLQRMGASIDITVQRQDWEPWGALTVRHRRLHGVEMTAADAAGLIDELPILMVVACLAQSESRFEGLGELRVKESDRLQAMLTGLQQLGASIELREPAQVVIRPSSLRGAVVESFHDHRIAMSLAIAALAAEGRTEIHQAECVAKSFGNFFELLSSIVSEGTVQTTS